MAEKRTRQTAQTRIFDQATNELIKLFPESGKILLTGGGKEFVERIGIEAIKKVVLSVLSGQNIRTQTEPLSRRRIAQVSGAIVAMFTQGYLTIEDFQNKLSSFAIQQLKTTRGNENVWPAQWVIGLTGKSVQNVLRSDQEAFVEYIKQFEIAIKEAAKHCQEQLGNYTMTLGYLVGEDGQQHVLDWEGIARLTTAIGAQTLAIRGSDKSMYGKLFERLVLGTVLTLLGFKRVDPIANKLTEGVFWLSDSSDNRESDATVIVSPGKLARFDIGFIGPGNSEISKDKLSRYGNVVVREGSSSSSVTFIVVDKLPETSKTLKAAMKISAEITQMSMQYWPRELSRKLGERFGFKHPMQNMNDAELQEYLNKSVSEIPVQEFLNNVTVEELEQEIRQEEIASDE